MRVYPYQLDRDSLQPLFWDLLGAAGLSGYGWPENGGGSDSVYETDVFVIRPYDGGMRDCTCGGELRAEVNECAREAAECTCGWFRTPEGADHNQNCGYRPNYDGSYCCTEECVTMAPNFLFKPTNVKVQWYKYALRTAYANVDLTKAQWQDIMRHCHDSLPTGKVSYV